MSEPLSLHIGGRTARATLRRMAEARSAWLGSTQCAFLLRGTSRDPVKALAALVALGLVQKKTKGLKIYYRVTPMKVITASIQLSELYGGIMG